MKAFAIPFMYLLIAIPLTSNSQKTEEQKIIDIITGELDYWYGKDRDKWANCIVQTSEFQLTTASPRSYHAIRTFDSLEATTTQHFGSPVEPDAKRIRKTDFHVSIKGNIAIADYTLRGDDFPQPFTGDQFIILEKQGKSWKALRQHTVLKSAYEVNEANVEANLNDQGYKLVQMQRLDDAIKVFTLNTQLFPNAWNTWDSLADAYLKKGEKQIAIGYFKKSIALNPKNEYAKQLVESLVKN